MRQKCQDKNEQKSSTDNFKLPNVSEIGALKRGNEQKNPTEEIIVKMFPNLIKIINSQIQKAQ